MIMYSLFCFFLTSKLLKHFINLNLKVVILFSVSQLAYEIGLFKKCILNIRDSLNKRKLIKMITTNLVNLLKLFPTFSTKNHTFTQIFIYYLFSLSVLQFL